MVLRIGAGKLFLHKATSIQVHALSNGFAANLDNGTVSVSSEEGRTFQLLTNGLAIQPAGLNPTAAQIERVSDRRVDLACRREPGPPVRSRIACLQFPLRSEALAYVK